MRIHSCEYLIVAMAALALVACTTSIDDAAARSPQAPSTSVPSSAADTPRKEDPRGHLVEALRAATPHSSLGAQAAVFDRLVGAWDSEYLTYGPDGTTTRRRAEVIFGWILDGRAVQDVWITYPDSAFAGERDLGTSIRFWDARLAAWRVIWVHPSTGVLITLSGGAVSDRIVLHGMPGDGSRLRWSFNDIGPDSFVWRGEVSRDNGKTWRLRNEHRMTRRVRSGTR